MADSKFELETENLYVATVRTPVIVGNWFSFVKSDLFWLSMMMPVILLVHGYHPYADDAGIYVAGVKKLADSTLYGSDSIFVASHTHFSIFGHVLAALQWATRLPIELLLFGAHLLSIFLFLSACKQLAWRIFTTDHVRWAAVLLASACFTLPVAGTALFVMDPYVTARSFSTPFGVLAISACLDRAWLRTILWAGLAVAMHPLMGLYLTFFLLTLLLVDSRWTRPAAAVCVFVLLFCGVIYASTAYTSTSISYQAAVTSRSYFYLANWHWFELLGLILPLLLMMIIPIKSTEDTSLKKLCITCALVGVTSGLCSLLFVHPSGSYFLARLQILRSFHAIYLVGVLMLGGFLGKISFERRPIVGVTLFLGAFLGMYYAQRQTYLTSSQVEWPYTSPSNLWQQSFLWIRSHTPSRAMFAADPDLVNIPGEDAQGFRAISERSLLADNKDGGVAAIFPALADTWMSQRNAQIDIDKLSDRERYTRLHPLGVDWILLSSKTSTTLPCPYFNPVVKVCRLVGE